MHNTRLVRRSSCEGGSAFDALSRRHKAFVKAYLTGPDRFNAAKSYLGAGYRSRHPKTCAHVLLQRPDVQAAIEEQMKESGLTSGWVRMRVGQIARGVDIADLEPYLTGRKTLAELRDEGVDTTLVRSARRVVTKGGRTECSVEVVNPMRAVAAAIRILGMPSDRHEVTVDPGPDFSHLSDDELKRLEHVLLTNPERAAEELSAVVNCPTDDAQR